MTLKNPTPRQLALYASLIIAAVNLLALIITKLIWGDLPWLLLFVVVFIVFITGYYVFAYALTRFIYRKIKVIYKAIHRLKRSKNGNGNTIDLRNHIIDEVEKEVLDWAKSQKKEIDTLKEMEAYRRNFLGNISHELKTPIFNIQGYLYTLLDGEIDDTELLKKYISRSVSNAERLNTIVQDLERIASLESGELAMDFQRFDVQALTREVFDDLEIKAQKRNIKLYFKEGSDRPYYVKGDREAIRQVITNLVSNSIKYGSENGFTKVGFYDMENQVLVEMTDNGIGISEAHLPHLFERFYRVDKGRSRDQGGTGLGLSIVKHIIEAHKQTINVRSRVNNGSTFGFTLDKA